MPQTQHGEQQRGVAVFHRCLQASSCLHVVVLIDRDRAGQQQQKGDGHRGGHRPVMVAEELIPQHAADHQVVRARRAARE